MEERLIIKNCTLKNVYHVGIMSKLFLCLPISDETMLFHSISYEYNKSMIGSMNSRGHVYLSHKRNEYNFLHSVVNLDTLKIEDVIISGFNKNDNTIMINGKWTDGYTFCLINYDNIQQFFTKNASILLLEKGQLAHIDEFNTNDELTFDISFSPRQFGERNLVLAPVLMKYVKKQSPENLTQSNDNCIEFACSMFNKFLENHLKGETSKSFRDICKENISELKNEN